MINSIIPKDTIDRSRLNSHSFDIPDYIVKSYGKDGNVVSFYKNGDGKYNIFDKTNGYFVEIGQYLKEHFKIDKLRPANRLEVDAASF